MDRFNCEHGTVGGFIRGKDCGVEFNDIAADGG